MVGKRGFVLVEVLVAMALLSFGFVLALEALSVSMKTIKTAESFHTASLLAQEKLSELIVAKPLQSGTDEGDFGEQYPSFFWELDTNPVSIETEDGIVVDDLLNEVKLTIFWKEGQKERKIELSTYLLAK